VMYKETVLYLCDSVSAPIDKWGGIDEGTVLYLCDSNSAPSDNQGEKDEGTVY